jgi:ribose transport system substrate-binding protein
MKYTSPYRPFLSSIVLSAAVLAAVSVAFPAFAADEAAGSAKPAGARLFVASFMTMHDPFFEDLNAGMKAAVEAHGDRFVLLDGEHSREKQEKGIIEILKQNPAAIFLIPATDVGSTDGILAATKRENVPVIIVDTDLNCPKTALCQVLTDNAGAGRAACQELARVNPNAKIGVLSFSLSKTCMDRVNGFKEEMAKHPGMKILDTQDGHANRDGVRGVIKDFLARDPDMDAIFAINDVSALEAITGIEAAGRYGKITVLGVAGSREGAQAIKEGKMHSSCAQNPKEMGRVAVEKAYDHLAGKAVEKDVRVPVKLVKKENADQYLK